MVHHLQQHVIDVRMRLLDLVQQHHRVRMLVDGLGQLAALLEADIARRRADQARHRVALHVLGHVEADQLDAEDVGQLARQFGLADAGRAGEQEGADGLLRIAQAGAGHLDRAGEALDRLLLAEHHVLQIALQVLQHVLVVAGDRLRRNAGDLGDDLFDLRLVDHLLLPRLRQDLLRGAASSITSMALSGRWRSLM
ncbi:Protein of uncharacterised function (DUF3170) [Chromobacterium violaceum]|uniref:Protein of uncharacterized function (DUF3170) n=1 Tax=Chromobacterium violaceum TaxID=536 RepID=A0A447TIZ8_CHRVL|nr:Protein of uncharacterised function (DUF3170) [Chromobacterium violaceum]